MSFKEIQLLEFNLIELGYQSIFLDQLRIEPRFDMMADVLVYMTNQLDPNFNIKLNISTSKERITFFKAYVAHLFQLVPQLSIINIANLYRSDISSVRELLKISKYIKSALETISDKSHVSSAINRIETKQFRSLCDNIADSGKALYFQLQNENELDLRRKKVLSESIDLNRMSGHIQEECNKFASAYSATVDDLRSVQQESKNIRLKIENKESELERRSERLKSLKHIRPAYMDEFEKLESELMDLYTKYVTRIKNVEWLEMKFYDNSAQNGDDNSSGAINTYTEQSDSDFTGNAVIPGKVGDRDVETILEEEDIFF
eukprot:NODE_157_length_15108_cov_0.423079.p5 type:complete len:318 gc:universal NODE_157_length_15108_cov_0.423079:3537-2584(-)